MLRFRAVWLIRTVFLCGAAVNALAVSPCLPCHTRQVTGFEKTPMAHSLSRSVHTPDGRFTHRLSGTKFIINPAGDTLQITMSRDGVSVTNAAAYVIGSGSHAYGFLTRVGSYL